MWMRSMINGSDHLLVDPTIEFHVCYGREDSDSFSSIRLKAIVKILVLLMRDNEIKVSKWAQTIVLILIEF